MRGSPKFPQNKLVNSTVCLVILLVTFLGLWVHVTISKVNWPSARGSKGHELNHLVFLFSNFLLLLFCCTAYVLSFLNSNRRTFSTPHSERHDGTGSVWPAMAFPYFATGALEVVPHRMVFAVWKGGIISEERSWGYLQIPNHNRDCCGMLWSYIQVSISTIWRI